MCFPIGIRGCDILKKAWPCGKSWCSQAAQHGRLHGVEHAVIAAVRAIPKGHTWSKMEAERWQMKVVKPRRKTSFFSQGPITPLISGWKSEVPIYRAIYGENNSINHVPFCKTMDIWGDLKIWNYAKAGWSIFVFHRFQEFSKIWFDQYWPVRLGKQWFGGYGNGICRFPFYLRQIRGIK